MTTNVEKEVGKRGASELHMMQSYFMITSIVSATPTSALFKY